MRWRAFVRSIRREAAATPAAGVPHWYGPTVEGEPEPAEPGVYVCGPAGGCRHRFYRTTYQGSNHWYGPMVEGMPESGRWQSWDDIEGSYGDCIRHLHHEYRHLYQYVAARDVGELAR